MEFSRSSSHSASSSGQLTPNTRQQLEQDQNQASRQGSLLSRRGNFSAFRSNTLSRFSRNNDTDDDSQEGKGRLGLNLLYDPSDEPASVDIIFVHGIGGGSRKTWAAGSDDEKFWPQAWLPVDPDFHDARIHSFGYLADWGKRATSTLNVHDFSQSLIGEVRNCPPIRRNDTRIIFVGHSMGGVIAKKAYIIAKQDPGLQELAARVQSMFFLGTPHRGSDLAGVLRNMLQVTWSSKPFINDLVSNSAALVEINDTFRYYSNDLRLWSFFETQSASNRLDVLVVDKYSATLGLPKEEISPLDADHRYVCKFKSQLDPNYRKVRNALSSAMDIARPERRYVEPVDVEATVKAYLGTSEIPEDDLAMLLDMKSPDSCLWFTETSSFSDWAASEPGAHSIQWLGAPPAAGKSIISSHVIDHLRTKGVYCSYYFFKQGKAGSRSLASLLLCLAFQMAAQDLTIAQRILKLSANQVSFESQDERSVWRKVFAGIFEGGLLDNHVWIIDGLDECHKFGSLFRLMAEFPLGLRAFVTSRITPEIERGVSSLGPSVHFHQLSPNDTLADIQNVIEAKVSELALGDTDTLTRRILSKSSGSFLWVTLVLQELEKAYTNEDIENILSNVPEDLGQLYYRILKTIELEKRRARLAKSVLTWIALAVRPLSVEELRCAVHLDINQTPVGQAIANACGPLILIDQSGRIQLIHETAREFLLSEDLESELAISRGSGHGRLAEMCLKYLNSTLRPHPSSRLLKGRSTTCPDVNLLEYASEAFSQHLFRSNSEDSGPFDALCTFLDHSVLWWIERASKSRNLGSVTQAAINLSAYMERRAKYVPPIDKSMQKLEAWALDLSRVPTKFRKALLQSPSSIHTIIPALCPTDSAIAQKVGEYIPSVAVAGLKDSTWDDCLMRVDYSKGLATAVGQGERYFAIGRSTGDIDVYDSATLQHVIDFKHSERVRFLEFTPGCEYLVSAGVKQLAFWDPRFGNKVEELPSHGPLAMCSADHFLMVASKNREVIMIDLESGDVGEQKWSDISLELPKLTPSKVVFSEVGLIAFAFRNHPVYILDVDRRVLLGTCTISIHNGVNCMAFNPNPDISALVVSFAEGSLVVFDTRTMEIIFRRPNIFAHCMACSADGRFLLTGSSSGLIEVFEFEGLNGAVPTLIYRIPSLPEPVQVVAFHSDGLRFVSLAGNKCRVWEPSVLVRKLSDTVSQSDLSGGASIPPRSSRTTEGSDKADITSVAVVQGHTVICGKSNGEVALFSTIDGQELAVLCRHATSVSRVEHCSRQDGFLIVTVSASGQIVVGVLQDLKQGNDYAKLLDKRTDNILVGAVISRTGERLLVHGKDFVYLWDISSGTQVATINYPKDDMLGIVNSPADTEEFVIHAHSGVQRHSWATMETLGALELSFDSKGPLSKVDKSWIKSQYLSSQEFVVEVRSHARDRHLTQFKCWNASNFTSSESSAPTTERENDFHFFNGMIYKLIALVGSVLYFVDKDSWVSSLDMKLFASTLVAKRYFFVWHDWIDGNGDIRCDMTSKQEVVLANKHGITIVKGGLDVAETVTYVPGTSSWKVVPATAQRRGLGSFSGSSSGSAESRPLSIQLRGGRRASYQTPSRMGMRRDSSSRSGVSSSIRRGSAQTDQSSSFREGSLD